MAHLECSPSMQEVLGFITEPYRPSVVVHAWNLNFQEMEVGGSVVQGRPLLYRKLEASLGYRRPCLKRKGGREGGDDLIDSY